MICVALVYAFFMLPIIIIALMSLSAGEVLAFPPQGISLRWFVAVFHNEAFMRAMGISLALAAGATVVSCIIGVAAALYVVRYATRARWPVTKKPK